MFTGWCICIDVFMLNSKFGHSAEANRCHFDDESCMRFECSCIILHSLPKQRACVFVCVRLGNFAHSAEADGTCFCVCAIGKFLHILPKQTACILCFAFAGFCTFCRSRSNVFRGVRLISFLHILPKRRMCILQIVFCEILHILPKQRVRCLWIAFGH